MKNHNGTKKYSKIVLICRMMRYNCSFKRSDFIEEYNKNVFNKNSPERNLQEKLKNS